LTARDLPPQLQALAILLPKRGYATETSTQGTGSGPPPGFNIKEAKKPLPKEETNNAASSPSVAELKKSDENTTVSQTAATAVSKTAASRNASLSDVAAEKAAEQAKAEGTSIVAKKEENKKLTIGQKIKKELAHYWDGTKLLATEVRISTKLALKMAAGYELSRRENRQVSIPVVKSSIIHPNKM
jgi:LETM1 and EF-hand domain-containing protein 1, mitochondrial